MERKVWMNTGQILYPNTYVFLVGTSGKGKTRVIDYATDILREIEDFRFAPTSITRASLVDVLAESKRKLPFRGPNAEYVEYNTLYIAIDELSAFMPEYNADIVSALTKFYDNNWYKEAKRVGHVRHDIDKPNMNILTGSTPTNLMRIFKQEVWTQGITGRTFVVFSDEDSYHNPLASRKFEKPTALMHDIQVIFSLYGQVSWTVEFNEIQDEWFKNGSGPPDHPLLGDYNKRRQTHLCKLAMISSVDRGDDLVLRKEDFIRAQGWLVEVEKCMTKIFQAGYITGDRQAMDELITYLRREGPQSWYIVRRQASYLTESYKLDKILDIMISTKEIKNYGGDKWGAA